MSETNINASRLSKSILARIDRSMEVLASIEHDRWARWHNYAKNNWTPENIIRWDRQAVTKYQDLTEEEKEKDRQEVRNYLWVIKNAIISMDVDKMTDDNVVCEGPYKVKKHKYWWCVDGLGEEDRLNQWAYKMGAEWWASQLNTAHADGVKSERERCAKIVENEPPPHDECVDLKWGIGNLIAKKIRGGHDGK